MFSPGKRPPKLGVLLTCADWRLHRGKVGLDARLRKAFGLDGLDFLTVPGPDGLIDPERRDEWAAVLFQVRLLIEVHAPTTLAVAGHERCAGNPVSDAEHRTAVMKTAGKLKEAVRFAGPVHAIMLVYHSDAKWGIETVAQY
jgi:hypothetical protein